MHKDYFEAILQLRHPSKEAEEFLLAKLERNLTKVKKVRNGFDFYVKSRKICVNLGKEANLKFGGDYNVSKKLFSRDKQSSKEIHRVNVLVRLPGFGKGSVIKFNDMILKVTGLSKKISGVDLKTGKKKVLKYPENFEVLKKYETRVVKVKPNVEVLHPETYQAEILQNPAELSVDQKVKVVISRGLWVV